MNNVYYLAHGGPGSGRYPLGSGDRPYQKFEKSRRKSSRGISGYIKSKKAKKAEEQQKKIEEETQKRKVAAEAEKERLEKDKDRVLREGSASEILKYQGQLSNKELQDAEKRIQLENSLRSYSDKEKKDALDKIKKIQNYTNTGSSLVKDGIELWNSFASIYNVTSEGKDNPLPLIGKGDKDKKNK